MCLAFVTGNGLCRAPLVAITTDKKKCYLREEDDDNDVVDDDVDAKAVFVFCVIFTCQCRSPSIPCRRVHIRRHSYSNFLALNVEAAAATAAATTAIAAVTTAFLRHILFSHREKMRC